MPLKNDDFVLKNGRSIILQFEVVCGDVWVTGGLDASRLLAELKQRLAVR